MATREVTESECDECGATETHPKHRRQRTTLPVKWVHVRAINSRGIELFNRDLCGGCAKPLVRA